MTNLTKGGGPEHFFSKGAPEAFGAKAEEFGVDSGVDFGVDFLVDFSVDFWVDFLGGFLGGFCLSIAALIKLSKNV